MTKRRLLMEIMSNFVTFAVFFVTLCIIYAVSLGYVPWVLFFSAIPFFAMYIMRKWINDIGIFILSQILFLLPAFFAFPDAQRTTFMMFFAVISITNSIACKVLGERILSFKHALAVITLLGLGEPFTRIILAGGEFGTPAPGILLVSNISAVLALTAVVVYVQMDNLDFDLMLHKNRGGAKAEKSVMTINNTLITVFSGTLGILALSSVLLPGGGIFGAVARFIGFFLNIPFQCAGWTAGEIIGEIEALPEPEVVEEMPPMEHGEDLSMMLEEGTWNFANLLVIIIVGVMAVSMLVFIVLIIMRAFLRKEKAKTVTSFSEEDTVEKMKFSFKDLLVFLPRFGGSKHPVRKAYIKKVNSHMKKGVVILPSYTPEIIAKAIKPEENIDQLTDEYEAVRYGKD